MNKRTLTSQLDQFALRSHHRYCFRTSHRNSRHPILTPWVRIDMVQCLQRTSRPFPNQNLVLFRSLPHELLTEMFKTTMTSQSRVSAPFLPFNCAAILECLREAIGYPRTFNFFYSFSRLKKKILGTIFLLNVLLNILSP